MTSPCTPSISVSEKPTRHLTSAEWYGRINDMREFAVGKRKDTSLLRNETHQIRNEAEIGSNWSLYRTNARLADRIAEVRHWLQILENANCFLKEEIDLLYDEKFEGEREIEAYFRGIEVVGECLNARDKRIERDLVYDESFKELHLELELLESSKKAMTEKCTEAFELGNKMKIVSTMLINDIADKAEALNIDSVVIELNKHSSQVCYKPDILRLPLEIVAPDTWLQDAQQKQAQADELSAQSGKLRETIRLCRERAKIDYLTQVEATNYTLRKRIHDANRLKNELEWQKKNTQEELNRISEEIEKLRICLSEHEPLLKCAETRHENRNLRPCMELIRDEAQITLVEEILHLRKVCSDIRDKIDVSINTYNQLETLIVKLGHEIENKELCIQYEMRAVSARKNLVEHQPTAQMDKDVVLVKMEKQIPPVPV